MNKRINMKSKLLILVIVFTLNSNFSFAGDIIINQTATVKNDGSGKIDLTYSAKNTTIKNYMAGIYPFAPKVAEKRFSSGNTKVESTGFYRTKSDTNIHNMRVVIDFTELGKLNQANAFSDVTASWKKTDNGNEFNWVVMANPKSDVQISQYTYKITFDDQVLSSNGQKVEGNTITWFKDKNIDPTKDIVLKAVIKSDGTSPSKDEKSCGLFGLELPLLILGGFVISQRQRRRKS